MTDAEYEFLAAQADKPFFYQHRWFWRQLLLVFICCLFFAGSLVTCYLWGAIFFGLCAAVSIWTISKDWKAHRRWASLEYVKEMKQSFQEIYDDDGVFEYDESGFTIQETEEPVRIAWNEIVSLLGYKRDNYTTDLICMDVFCAGSRSFTITEETPGWFQFQRHLAEAYPSIAGWEADIAVPAFETMLRVVYDRENRTIDELTRLYYS